MCVHPANIFASRFDSSGHDRRTFRSAMNIRATPAEHPRPRYLMCHPQHFAVTYSINPWMDPKAWADSSDVLQAAAAQQWDGLHRTLIRHGAGVEVLEPARGMPDLVFTANAAVVLDGKPLLARFR